MNHPPPSWWGYRSRPPSASPQQRSTPSPAKVSAFDLTDVLDVVRSSRREKWAAYRAQAEADPFWLPPEALVQDIIRRNPGRIEKRRQARETAWQATLRKLVR